jgi:endonuclease-3 related protein
VDAYTRRVLERHGAIAPSSKYEEIRELVERALRKAPLISSSAAEGNRPSVHLASLMSSAERSVRAQVFNEMHGLFVQLGKHYCSKSAPKCETCPLGAMLVRSVAVPAPAKLREPARAAKRNAEMKASRRRVK